MHFLLSTETKRQINLLYGNRLHYLTSNSFCPSFINYLERVSRDFDSLLSGNVKYSINNGFRYTELTAIAITYKLLDIGVIVIHDIGFIGLGLLKKRCTYDRRVAHITLGKRPFQTTRGIVSDYVQSNINGGKINGVTVHIVKRKGMTSRSNKPLFNYLFQGKLLSRYDVLNPTPFTQQQDGEVKAYADACNGRGYWLYPTGKWRLVRESRKNNKSTLVLTEQQFDLLISTYVKTFLQELDSKSKDKKQKGKKQLGNYTAIDGMWMIMRPKGLENFGRIQDVRMYDNDLFKGSKHYETIVLFRHVDSMKFFYAKIIPKEESNGVKWAPIRIDEVPKIIVDDLKTINPSGHQPYRPH